MLWVDKHRPKVLGEAWEIGVFFLRRVCGIPVWHRWGNKLYIYIHRISVYCNAFELVQFGAESLLLHVGLNIFQAH